MKQYKGQPIKFRILAFLLTFSFLISLTLTTNVYATDSMIDTSSSAEYSDMEADITAPKVDETDTIISSLVVDMGEWANSIQNALTKVALKTITKAFSPTFYNFANLEAESHNFLSENSVMNNGASAAEGQMTLSSEEKHKLYDYDFTHIKILASMWNVAMVLGLSLASVLIMVQLMTLLIGGPEQKQENIIKTVIFYMVSLFAMYMSKDIISTIVYTLDNVWQAANSMVAETYSVSDSLAPVGGTGTGKVVLLGIALAGGGVFSAVILIIGLICHIVLLCCLLRLLKEMIERYFVFIILVMFFPLAASTLSSAATRRTFSSYIKMLLSEFLTMIITSVLMYTWVRLWVDGVWTCSIINFITARIFVIICERIDSYLSRIGLNPAHTGSGCMRTLGQGFTQIVNTVSHANSLRHGAADTIQDAAVKMDNSGLNHVGHTLGMTVGEGVAVVSGGKGNVESTWDADFDEKTRKNKQATGVFNTGKETPMDDSKSWTDNLSSAGIPPRDSVFFMASDLSEKDTNGINRPMQGLKAKQMNEDMSKFAFTDRNGNVIGFYDAKSAGQKVFTGDEAKGKYDSLMQKRGTENGKFYAGAQTDLGNEENWTQACANSGIPTKYAEQFANTGMSEVSEDGINRPISGLTAEQLTNDMSKYAFRDENGNVVGFFDKNSQSPIVENSSARNAYDDFINGKDPNLNRAKNVSNQRASASNDEAGQFKQNVSDAMSDFYGKETSDEIASHMMTGQGATTMKDTGEGRFAFYRPDENGNLQMAGFVQPNDNGDAMVSFGEDAKDAFRQDKEDLLSQYYPSEVASDVTSAMPENASVEAHGDGKYAFRDTDGNLTGYIRPSETNGSIPEVHTGTDAVAADMSDRMTSESGYNKKESEKIAGEMAGKTENGGGMQGLGEGRYVFMDGDGNMNGYVMPSERSAKKPELHSGEDALPAAFADKISTESGYKRKDAMSVSKTMAENGATTLKAEGNGAYTFYKEEGGRELPVGGIEKGKNGAPVITSAAESSGKEFTHSTSAEGTATSNRTGSDEKTNYRPGSGTSSGSAAASGASPAPAPEPQSFGPKSQEEWKNLAKTTGIYEQTAENLASDTRRLNSMGASSIRRMSADGTAAAAVDQTGKVISYADTTGTYRGAPAESRYNEAMTAMTGKNARNNEGRVVEFTNPTDMGLSDKLSGVMGMQVQTGRILEAQGVHTGQVKYIQQTNSQEAALFDESKNVIAYVQRGNASVGDDAQRMYNEYNRKPQVNANYETNEETGHRKYKLPSSAPEMVSGDIQSYLGGFRDNNYQFTGQTNPKR